jgi:hypothetical protein
MLGILVILMSPSSTYLRRPAGSRKYRRGDRGKFDQKFGDYLCELRVAGEQRREAACTAEKLDEKWIDNGNSRSYLLAWLMSLKP